MCGLLLVRLILGFAYLICPVGKGPLAEGPAESDRILCSVLSLKGHASDAQWHDAIRLHWAHPLRVCHWERLPPRRSTLRLPAEKKIGGSVFFGE